MQKTANEIKSSFELLASGHYQIHSFLYAQEFEQQAYENLIYPLMLVYPLGGSLSGTSYTRNYRVVIADRVLKSEGNELEVESDTQLIALDTLAYWMKLGTNERFSITSSNTITPFWEKWGDEVTGHFVDIGIEEFYDFNSCAIPLSSAIPSPTNPCKDARILINSVVYGNAPSDTNFNVVVKDQLGALVGSLIGGEWIVNVGSVCADATYTIEDSLGNVLYTGTIPSGGSVTEVIGNSTLNVNKSDGTLISSRSILAEGTDSYNVGDSSAVLKDEDGNVLSTTPIKATESKDIVAPNGDVSVNSVAFDDVLSGGTLNIQVSKSTGNDLIGSKQGQYWRIGDSTITNSDSTYDVDVKATESLSLPDSQINVNSVDSGDVVSVKTIDVNLEDSLGAPVVPTSVGLVGNTLTIEVPTGGTPMNVDFSADKLTAFELEDITFTDLSDQTPTHWSWRFNDGTTSILQNVTKSFSTLGFKNVTLLAGKIGAGGVNIKNNYIEILANYLSNLFGNPAAAYSLRKLTPNSVYSGAAIRVRRSSDNTEQDINFVSSLANATIDTTALLTFVGAGNGFVTTIYNQNGSGEHLTQTTASSQPRIVLSGVVDTLNSLPSMVFDGSNNFMSGGNILSIGLGNNMQSHAVTSMNNNNAIYAKALAAGLTNRYALLADSGSTFSLLHDNVSNLVAQNTSIATLYANQRLFNQEFIRNTSNKLFVNNNNVATYIGSVGEVATRTTRFLLGAYSNATDTGEILYLNGKVQELVIYIQPTLPNLSNVNININAYYNVF
jgi:PKD repeat protein